MDNGASCYRRFLEGDDNGLAEIIKEYNSGLTLYLNSFVNDISLADELSEDTFVKIGIKKPHFSEKSSFKTWLYAIGRNIALDHLRKAARRNDIPIDDCLEIADEKTLEEEYLKEERKIILHRAMRKLKTEYRQILYLIYFENLSIKQSAQIMKKTVHSTETLVYRARTALKAELEKENFKLQ